MPFDTEYTALPMCPYCGKEDRDWWNNCGDPAPHDGGFWEVSCSCGKDYTVTLSVSRKFSTEKVF